MKVRFANSARRDLRDIFVFLGRENPPAARRIVAAIKSRVAGLAQHPLRGQVVRRAYRRELRRLVIHPYIVIYEVETTVVSIVRVVHGARDLDAVLRRETGDKPD